MKDFETVLKLTGDETIEAEEVNRISLEFNHLYNLTG